jgi:hypothetical protein
MNPLWRPIDTYFMNGCLAMIRFVRHANRWLVECMQMRRGELMAEAQAISWTDGVDRAIESAREQQRSVLLDFSAAPM